MNDELERVWKEVVVAYSRSYCGIYLKSLKKPTRSSGLASYVPAEAGTQHLSNTNL
jgi:hypothetical protein